MNCEQREKQNVQEDTVRLKYNNLELNLTNSTEKLFQQLLSA